MSENNTVQLNYTGAEINNLLASVSAANLSTINSTLNSKITMPSNGVNGQFLKYDGTNAVWSNIEPFNSIETINGLEETATTSDIINKINEIISKLQEVNLF